MSFVIEIRFKEDVGHHLFIRNHQTRLEQQTRPKGRTLLICNIPPWCPNKAVSRLFGRFGKLENVEVNIMHRSGLECYTGFTNICLYYY